MRVSGSGFPAAAIHRGSVDICMNAIKIFETISRMNSDVQKVAQYLLLYIQKAKADELIGMEIMKNHRVSERGNACGGLKTPWATSECVISHCKLILKDVRDRIGRTS